MSYSRRRYYRRRRPYYRKRRYGARKKVSKLQKMTNDSSASGWSAGNVASAAFTALKIANGLKGLINSERKYIDKTGSFTQGTVPSITRLTEIAQGDTETTRDGDSVLMKTLTIRERGVIHNSSTSSVLLRRVIVVDTRCDGVLPGMTDIFTTTSLTTHMNNDQDGRFVILKDNIFRLSAEGTRDYYKKLHLNLNIHCKYDGSGSIIDDAKGNQIYYIIWSNDNTNQPSVDFNSRIRFTDN